MGRDEVPVLPRTAQRRRKELDAAEQKVVKLAKGTDGAPVESDFTAEE